MNKIKTAAVCAALVAAAFGTTAFAAENLLGNGGMETETLGVSGWRFRESGGWSYESENAPELVSGDVREGEHALRFNSATVAQRVRLQRNVSYKLEFYIKADEPCEVRAGFFDGSQDWPGGYVLKAENISVGTEWTKAVLEFECPNTQDYVVHFCLWDRINVYLDDVSLKEEDSYIARLEQKLDGLPDGTYTMTAWVKSSGGQSVCSLYAESGDKRYSRPIKTEINEWTEIVVADDIEVKDGSCRIGLYSDAEAGEWVKLDNLRLVKNIE